MRVHLDCVDPVNRVPGLPMVRQAVEAMARAANHSSCDLWRNGGE
jgi:hypothetical protein